ncbi:MAG TPA: M20/M25/M40 family metallo-hydrolase [Casimicrobiaceae bacterium]|nr:M20/M25/M40 family metallo-hydrolase [Casimicrobiaceae bacterium]
MSAPAALVARIDATVDALHDEEVAFLRELVRMPTDTPPGDNAPAAERTAALLEAMGFAVERLPVPRAEVEAAGLASVTNLVVRRRFGDGPVVALNAHGDVVPPGEGWTKPPYEGVVEDGRMFGRGVAVSKSDIATFAFALRALEAGAKQCGAALAGGVELHFTFDEEFGGALGPAWLLRHGLTKPDLAIGPGFSYAIVTAHNGCLQLEVTVQGRAAHAAMPATGIDALQAAVRILEAIYAQNALYAAHRSALPGIECPTVNVGRIEGGTNTNVVPAKVVMKLDRRIIPDEDVEAAEAGLRDAIARAASQTPGVHVDVRRLMLARPLAPLPGHERLVATLSRHAGRVFGEPVTATATPLYTDARLYGEAGVPVVLYGAGPRTILEANAKRADENLLLDDLRRATKVVAATLADLLTPGPRAQR